MLLLSLCIVSYSDWSKLYRLYSSCLPHTLPIKLSHRQTHSLPADSQRGRKWLKRLSGDRREYLQWDAEVPSQAVELVLAANGCGMTIETCLLLCYCSFSLSKPVLKKKLWLLFPFTHKNITLCFVLFLFSAHAHCTKISTHGCTCLRSSQDYRRLTHLWLTVCNAWLLQTYQFLFKCKISTRPYSGFHWTNLIF